MSRRTLYVPLAALSALCLLGPAMAVTMEFTSADTPLPINDMDTATSVINVPAGINIADLNVKLNLTHTYPGDLHIVLTSPGGDYSIQLVTDVYWGWDTGFINTVFDDEAATSIYDGSSPWTGSFRPDEALSVFDGTLPGGSWVLDVDDQYSGDVGTLISWALVIEGTFPEDLTPPVITIESVAPSQLWPPNNKLVTVHIFGHVTDVGTGVEFLWCDVDDSEDKLDGRHTLTVEADGSFYHEMQLRASRSSSGRVPHTYELNVCAQDGAGNFAESSAIVTVPHDQRNKPGK